MSDEKTDVSGASLYHNRWTMDNTEHKPLGFMATWDIITALNLIDAYTEAIQKICQSRHMMQDQAGSKY
jgi:hypothetical protein